VWFFVHLGSSAESTHLNDVEHKRSNSSGFSKDPTHHRLVAALKSTPTMYSAAEGFQFTVEGPTYERVTSAIGQFAICHCRPSQSALATCHSPPAPCHLALDTPAAEINDGQAAPDELMEAQKYFLARIITEDTQRDPAHDRLVAGPQFPQTPAFPRPAASTSAASDRDMRCGCIRPSYFSAIWRIARSVQSASRF
jgi:hypothetical protein